MSGRNNYHPANKASQDRYREKHREEYKIYNRITYYKRRIKEMYRRLDKIKKWRIEDGKRI